jgi:hypothetical protein
VCHKQREPHLTTRLSLFETIALITSWQEQQVLQGQQQEQQHQQALLRLSLLQASWLSLLS